jgi:hypothetical protein
MSAASPSAFSLLLYPLVHIITLEVTGLSAVYVYRQKLTAYKYTKGLLLAVHALFIGVVIFEFLRTVLLSMAFIGAYTLGGTLLILADVLLLTLLAVSVYLVPSGLGTKNILRLMWERKIHVVLFSAYAAYIIYIGAYLVVYMPFTSAQVAAITGALLPSTKFDTTYLLFLLVTLVIFILYPSSLLFLASRKVKDADVRRVLRILPIAWSGIGLELLIFNGYLLSAGLDATPFGYLIASGGFGATAVVFRRASLLTSFFEPVKPTATQVSAGSPFTDRLGMQPAFLKGRSFLLEIDPSVPYEQLVSDFATQCLSSKMMVYVFSAKGNPVYDALNKISGLRFYILSSKVSYPKPDEQPYQILIPNNDQAVLLDIIDKTVAVGNEGEVAIVFDSISDSILSSGFEAAYKFVKQVNETLGGSRTTSLFLMTLGAHDEKVVSFIKSLFPNQLVDDKAGVRVTRSQ